jgi:hypothetical protein
MSYNEVKERSKTVLADLKEAGRILALVNKSNRESSTPVRQREDVQ